VSPPSHAPAALSTVFRSAVGGPAIADQTEHDSLAALYARGHAAWPSVRLEAERFVAHLGHVLGAVGYDDGLVELRDREIEDLYLACACLAHDPDALSLFEARCVAPVADHARRGADRAFADDVTAALRERLLVGDGDAPPKLASYSGRGALGAWVRVIAARLKIDLQRAQGRKRETTLAADAPDGEDPERKYMQEHYRPELREAFAAALAALGTRERNLLKLHYVEGMSTAALGAMYKVESRSVQRWLVDVRANLLAEVERQSASRGLDTGSQLRSMMRSLNHDLDIGISQILRQPGA
jgi:RNA polymerase sigma-70 factor (ECF subfamily)